jgi:hypothetical protein
VVDHFTEVAVGMGRRPLYSCVYIGKIRHRHWRCIVKHLCVARVGALTRHVYPVHDPNIVHSIFW